MAAHKSHIPEALNLLQEKRWKYFFKKGDGRGNELCGLLHLAMHHTHKPNYYQLIIPNLKLQKVVHELSATCISINGDSQVDEMQKSHHQRAK